MVPTTTLVFTLTNGAGNPAQGGIAFTDTLPSGLAINSATPALSYSAGCSGPATGSYVVGTRVLSLSGLAMSGGTATCSVTVAGVTNATAQVNASCPAAAFTNGAAAMGGLANVTNGVTDQCLVVDRVNPSLTKAFAPATISQGGVSTLTFTLTNAGTNPAQSGIDFTDTLPANVVIAGTPNVTSSCPSGTGAVTATAGTGTITVAGATMNAAQASCTVTVDVTSNTAGVYANTNAGNIGGTANVTTTGVNATLTVQSLPTLTKAFSPTTVGVGQNSVLTFTITNPAGAPARTGLTFTDALPIGAVIGTPNGLVNGCGGTPTITATAGAGTITIAGTGVNAAIGASACTISLSVTSSTAGAYVNGAAEITAIGGMLNGVTNQTLTVTQASLTKAFAPATIGQGGISTLTFTLANGAGNPAQSGINFTDTLPANVTIAATPNVTSSCPSGTGVVTATAGTGTITVAGATMNAAQASCTVTVDVTSNTVGVYANTNAGNISATQRVTTTGVNATLTVQALPTLTKAFSLTTVGVGQNSVLTFTITNPAGAPARTGLTFTDALAGRRRHRHAQRAGERLRWHADDHGDRGVWNDHHRRHRSQRCHRRVELHDPGERHLCHGGRLRERRGRDHRHRRDAQRGHEPDAHRHAGVPHQGLRACHDRPGRDLDAHLHSRERGRQPGAVGDQFHRHAAGQRGDRGHAQRDLQLPERHGGGHGHGRDRDDHGGGCDDERGARPRAR